MLKYVLTFGLAIVIAPVSASAQESNAATVEKTKSLGIAFVNMKRIMTEAAAIRDISKQINVYKTGLEKKIRAEREKLRDAKARLEKQASLLDPKVIEEKRADFRKQVNDFTRGADDRVRALRESDEGAVAIVRKALNEVIVAFVQENRIGMVVNEKGVVFVVGELDRTAEILDALNKKLPKVKVAEPRVKKADK